MAWIQRALSLRAKITASFTLIVVGGTVVSTLIGARIITTALIEQAQVRARQGLEAARTTYDERLADVRTAVGRAAATLAAEEDLAGSDEAVAARLNLLQRDGGLDFLGLATNAGAVIHGNPDAPASTSGGMLPPAVLRGALAGAVATTEVVPLGFLRAEGPGLAARVRAVSALEGPAAAVQEPPAGLVLLAAAPVRAPRRFGRRAAALRCSTAASC